MAKDVVIVRSNEVEPEDVNGMAERNLAGRFNGSERIGVEHAIIPAGLEAKDVVYENEDEVVYIIKGKCEIGIKGNPNVLGPGDFFFVPQGEPYDFKVVDGPMEVLGAFNPPRA